MTTINSFFQFSRNQLRFVLALGLSALLMGAYLFVRSYATPTEEPISIPILLADSDRNFTGVFQLDPNTAPVDSLELLPGIGKALADRIISYRQDYRFEHEVDLTNVKGIGPQTFEKLRPYLRIRR